MLSFWADCEPLICFWEEEGSWLQWFFFLGSVEISLAEKMYWKNSSWDLLYSHFSAFSLTFFSRSLCKTAVRLLSSCSCVVLYTMMSSLMFLTLGTPCSICWMTFWKTSVAELMSKLSLVYLQSPVCVVKVVMYLNSGWSSGGWYPAFKSRWRSPQLC